MYSFLPILIIFTGLTYQLCPALALGESRDGESLAVTEARHCTGLPTQLVTRAASYNTIR